MAAESKLERRLVREVQLIGGRAYKFTSPARPGVPDRLIVLPPHGFQCFVELKAPEGRVSRLQRHELNKLAAMGVTVYLAWEERHITCLLSIFRSHITTKRLGISDSVRAQASFLTWGSAKLASLSITSSAGSKGSTSEEC